MKLKPLDDRVVIEVKEEMAEKNVGGIIIPDSAKEKPQEAIIKAVGPGRLVDGNRVPLEVKNGETVLISKYGGTEIKYDDKEYILIREDDILAVIE